MMIRNKYGRVAGSVDIAEVAQLLAETTDEELRAYYRGLLGESQAGLALDERAQPAVMPEPEPEVDLDGLRAQAETLGVKVDRRWGPDRLRAEIAAASEE